MDEIINAILNSERGLAEALELSKRRFNGTYTPNVEKMKKFAEVSRYFHKLVETCGGKVLEETMEPTNRSGDITVELPMMEMSGDNLTKFANIISLVDVIGIEPTLSGTIVFCAAVNDVWIATKNNK